MPDRRGQRQDLKHAAAPGLDLTPGLRREVLPCALTHDGYSLEGEHEITDMEGPTVNGFLHVSGSLRAGQDS